MHSTAGAGPVCTAGAGYLYTTTGAGVAQLAAAGHTLTGAGAPCTVASVRRYAVNEERTCVFKTIQNDHTQGHIRNFESQYK